MTRRHKLSATNKAPLEKDITRAMKLLIDHNLMFSSNFLLDQLQALNNWFKVCNSDRRNLIHHA